MLQSLKIFAMAVVVLSSSMAFATIKTYQAFLSGLGENPPNASPASGFGMVTLDDVALTITCDENWAGLVSPATASHIHGPGGVGVNAPVLFPFSGVPAATSGAIPTQGFSITAAQVAQFDAGLMYMNVHTSVFPGGEIRDQLRLVPEPGSLALIGLVSAAGLARRRR